MNIEINTTEKTLIIKGFIAFSDLIEFIKSKGFEDYSLKSENNAPHYGYFGTGMQPYTHPYNGLIGGTTATVIDCNLNNVV